MERESSHRDPESPLGPLAAHWVNELSKWYSELQTHFEFNPNNLASNVRRSSARWRLRLQYINEADPQHFEYLMQLIDHGHRIPFGPDLPHKFFRKGNPPSFAADKVRAWEAIFGDIQHGAIEPVNTEKCGIPWCVCPVRTADKSNGKARFVHNSRRVNKSIPKHESACTLESLLRTRNMYVPGGFVIGSDFASGYHCIDMVEEHRTYLGFALHLSELTPEALAWLRLNHPESYCHAKRAFIFRYTSLPFGLSTSCKAFNSLITALVGFWRLCPSEGRPTRASSYIDDILSAHLSFDSAMRMSIRIVYESASLGLALRIPKCSFFPRHAIKALGTIVDLSSFKFRVAKARNLKIQAAIQKLFAAVETDHNAVPAKLIASFVGLIWSVATCCHRAASVMVRSITHTLTRGMRACMHDSVMSLQAIMRHFWSGTVQWAADAHNQLTFWSNVDFLSLESPISADVLGKSLESTFARPHHIDHSKVTYLFQDSSDTASGGGTLSYHDGFLTPSDNLFLAMFTDSERLYSSTLRELLGILRCLQATHGETSNKVIFACDNQGSCSAVRFGSRTPAIQHVAEQIFTWCLEHSVICWPVWLPRTHPLIKEADRRSRLRIAHDERSPQKLVDFCDRLANERWGRHISFDQMASHRSSIRICNRALPFNASCWQPGAQAVDSFMQWKSWADNVNYVYPPTPMIGRLVTFLPSTNSRAIVVFPRATRSSWWSFAVQRHSDGVCAVRQFEGFTVVVFDFRPGNNNASPSRP